MATRYEFLRDFCKTDTQRDVLEAVIASGGNQSAAGKALGKCQSSVCEMMGRIERYAAREAVAPHRNVDKQVMEGFEAKRVSTAYNNEGEVALQWVIQEPERRSMREKVEAMMEGLKDDLTGFRKAVKAPKIVDADLMAVYIIGDHHFGMLADGDTKLDDDNYDVKIATKVLTEAVDKLASRVGNCERAVLLNVGDFFHEDGKQTTSLGTKVDVDSRIAKTFKLAGRLFQTLITRLLENHKHVTVVNVRGNHDTDMACHLSSALELLYQNEPRIHILPNYSKFLHMTFGNNLFVFHHGDRIKHEQILQAVITNLDDQWSASKKRYCHLGHIHHHTRREVGSMHFEHWGSLTATDQWHSDSGYGAERSMTAVIYHKQKGEDSRVKIGV